MLVPLPCGVDVVGCAYRSTRSPLRALSLPLEMYPASTHAKRYSIDIRHNIPHSSELKMASKDSPLLFVQGPRITNSNCEQY